jgi:hypothetical protein
MIVRAATFAGLAGVAVLVAGCTSSHSTPQHTASQPPATSVPAASSPASVAVTPVSTGPTTAAAAASCPYAGTEFVHNTVGMRLGKLTVLKSGGKIVGCRFYPLSHPTAQCDATCLQGEHLPGPNQPVVEITTQRYASSVAAHNAFVLVAQRGANPQQADLGGGIVGVCYQTDFYAKDHGTDWACAASKGTTAVFVRTVVTSPALNAKLVTQQVVRAL